MTTSLNDLLKSKDSIGLDKGKNLPILAFDPGETTGVVALNFDEVGQKIVPIHISQVRTPALDADTYRILDKLISDVSPTVLVIEEYRVFNWKRDQHIWSELHTPKLIGMIIAVAMRYGIPYTYQTPQVAKGFCTDQRLKDWNLYVPANRHAMDAMRHAIYYLLFGGKAKIVPGEVHDSGQT